MEKLWYQKPADEWEEALPLGNGRLGAMVFGQIQKEQIQVNEESIWYGKDGNESIQMPRKICLKSENTFEMVRFKRHRNL